MQEWLRTEFEIQDPGKWSENLAELDLQTFVDEVRKRRLKTAKKLTPAALKALREGYTEQIEPLRQDKAEKMMLERNVSDLVNGAYGLMEEEIEPLWNTAPPRMPLGRL